MHPFGDISQPQELKIFPHSFSIEGLWEGPTNYCPRLPGTARDCPGTARELPGNCPGTARGLPETAWAVWSCFKSLSTCIKVFFKTFSMLRFLRFVAFRRTLFLTHGCCIFVVTWVVGQLCNGKWLNIPFYFNNKMNGAEIIGFDQGNYTGCIRKKYTVGNSSLN
jgi:hypothetical protein